MASTDLANKKEQLHPSPSTSFKTGRTVGVLLLLQLATGLTLPFILLKPLSVGFPGFLSAGTEYAMQIHLSIILSFVGAALTVCLGVVSFRQFYAYSKVAAITFLIVCAISCTLDLVHAGSVMSMLAVSNKFIVSGAAERGLYQVVGIAVATARRSAHAIQLLAIGAWIFVFYFTLLRFKLVPVLLAALGILGITLQFIGVTLMIILGYPTIGVMAMPLLPIQITVIIWLIIKGFNSEHYKSTEA